MNYCLSIAGPTYPNVFTFYYYVYMIFIYEKSYMISYVNIILHFNKL